MSALDAAIVWIMGICIVWCAFVVKAKAPPATSDMLAVMVLGAIWPFVALYTFLRSPWSMGSKAGELAGRRVP